MVLKRPGARPKTRSESAERRAHRCSTDVGLRRLALSRGCPAQLLVALLLVLLSVAAVASPSVLTPWEKSGHFTSLEELDGFVHGLVSTADWKVAVQQLGSSALHHDPIWAVHLTPSSPARLKVLVLARVHGNEPAATEAALTLIRDVVSGSGDNAPLYRNFEYEVVPCLNPEGAARALTEADGNDGWWGATGRDNDVDVDINRDYLRLSTPEARAAVSLYDSFQPDVVLDLHEYESRPLVAGDGWWRSQYWDLLVGAGRAPWASPSLRHFCRSIVEDSMFPALQQKGVRAEFYMLPTGNFDSSMHFASNAADYFLVRGTPAFLLESAGSDEGEGSATKRVNVQRTAIDALLQALSQHPEQLASVVQTARQESAAMHTVALDVVPHKRAVKLMGTTGMGFGFDGKIDVGGRTYNAHQIARFEGLDYDIGATAPLPPAFLIQTRDPQFLRVLTLHGLTLTASSAAFRVGTVEYPAGTVVATASTPLAGLLLLQEVRDRTPNHLPASGVVVNAPTDFLPPAGKPVVSLQDCVQATRRTRSANGE